MVMRRKEEAVAKIERAMELDPYNIRTQSFQAVVLMHTRRFDDAIALARKVLSAQPRNGVALNALADSLFMKGMHDDPRYQDLVRRVGLPQ